MAQIISHANLFVLVALNLEKTKKCHQQKEKKWNMTVVQAWRWCVSQTRNTAIPWLAARLTAILKTCTTLKGACHAIVIDTYAVEGLLHTPATTKWLIRLLAKSGICVLYSINRLPAISTILYVLNLYRRDYGTTHTW